MTKKKVCLIGSFAVGKTSLVRQFVQGFFSDEYHTTVGVKVDRRSVAIDGEDVLLIVWDVAGRDDIQAIQKKYLRGASGFIYVADGTRRETLEEALEEIENSEPEFENAAKVLLLNKADLTSDWELEEETVDDLRAQFPVYVTSAKTGQHVEEAFAELARRMLGAGESGK